MIAPCKLPIAVFKSVPCCLTVFTPAIFDAALILDLTSAFCALFKCGNASIALAASVLDCTNFSSPFNACSLLVTFDKALLTSLGVITGCCALPLIMSFAWLYALL
ncbi:Uncharacterised protein [Staphylococcus aureus]|nr:Uncharacterised protein [Staphylococcus aureus]